MRKILWIIGLIIISGLVLAPSAYAIVGFGGKIIKSFPCLNGVYLLVSPPVGGSFLFPYGAKLYPHFQLRPGVWVLGIFAPGGVCLVPSFFGVTPIPVQGTILFLGTSMY